MKKTYCLIVLMATVVPQGVLRAEDDADAVERIKSAGFFAPADSADYLKFAPDRDVEVMHFALDVTPDFKHRTVAGTAVWKFKPLIKPVEEIKLDAVELAVESVTATEKIQAYQSTEDKLIITFAAPIPADKEVAVTIKYHAEPADGLYFRTPEMGYKEGDTHLFSQGEEISARHWFPCFDSPNEKFTSEMTCHVPEGMTVISNGRLVDEEKDANGLVASHWSQEQPHANYLITLAAGYFKKVEGKHKNTPLAFFTPASEFNEAANSFRDTEDIMEFFEQEIGVPYPWAKYYQVCVNDFVAGGMENTSATTLTDSTLFTDATENIHSSESLVAHEMAHQWFGDLVTCKDWSHIWLNEGAATYYQVLYAGHKHGRDEMLYDLYHNAKGVLSAANDTNAIVRRDYDDPFEMFGYLAYPKGGWVLHMLRSELGEKMYQQCIKTYLERHRYGSVVTEDLRKVIEELTGRSYDQFFDQWLYHAHYPELEVSQTWDERAKLAKISVRQVQKLGPNVRLFNFPLPIRFKGKFGVVDGTIHVTAVTEDFYFPLESAPELVRLDPGYTLLAKIHFSIPTPMLYAQLADKNDLIGRLLAIEQLADRRDKESVAKLKQTLDNDAFYGARVEAARALRAIHSDEALEALLDSTKQSDARVRSEVVGALGGFYRESAYAKEVDLIAHEKNPAIEAEEIQGMSGYAKPDVRDMLLKFLTMDSYRNELADAAIRGMRSQDNPQYLAPLLAELGKDESKFTSRGYASAIGTLAYLARHEEKKDAVREFLMPLVNHKKRGIRLAAISALGTLGDPKAIAVLERFAAASKSSPEQGPAERAVTELRADRRPADDFKNLRGEVMDLEKANRDLHKELDDLKKKVEAKDAASTNATGRRKK